MTTLDEKQRELTARLSSLKTGEERLAWLVDNARRAPSLQAELRVENNLVPGCLARLWLVSEFRDGRCHFSSDSDSMIVKAVAGLLCELYSGQKPGAIVAHDPDFLRALGITQHLTPNRRNSLSRVWEHIRIFAAAQSAGRPR